MHKLYGRLPQLKVTPVPVGHATKSIAVGSPLQEAQRYVFSSSVFGQENILPVARERPLVETAVQPLAPVKTSAPIPEIDFGLENFFKRFTIPEALRKSYKLIHEPKKETFILTGDMLSLSQALTLRSHLHWIEEAQKALTENVDAQKALAEIKFKLRVRLKFDEYKSISKRDKALSASFVHQVEALLKPNSDISSLVTSLSLYSKSAYEKRLLAHIKNYKKSYDHVLNKKVTPATVVATEPKKELMSESLFFPRVEKSDAEKLRIDFTMSVTSGMSGFDAAKKNEFRGILRSKKSVSDMQDEIRKLTPENEGFLMRLSDGEGVKEENLPEPQAELSAESLKQEQPLHFEFSQKLKEERELLFVLSQLRDQENTLKKEVLTVVNSLGQKPASLSKLSSLDENKAEYIRDSGNKDKEWFKNAADMRWWDRARVRLGFNPSAVYRNREAEVRKYFDFSLAQVQIQEGLTSEKGMLERGVNKLFNHKDYQRVSGFVRSLHTNKDNVVKNNAELKAVEEKLSTIQKQLDAIESQVDVPNLGLEIASPPSKAITPQ